LFSENEFSNLSIRKFNQTHVYIVDDHQFVLPIWAYYSLSKNVKYSLLTFDFHTDTRQAFTKYACVQNSGKPFKDVNNFRKNHMKEINRNDLKSICIETNNLANDEHIRAAMEFGFIQHPHVITVDKTYSDPDINYYKIDNIQDIVEIKETDDPYQGDLPFLRKLYLNRLEDDYIRSTGFKACKLTEP